MTSSGGVCSLRQVRIGVILMKQTHLGQGGPTGPPHFRFPPQHSRSVGEKSHQTLKREVRKAASPVHTVSLGDRIEKSL